MYGNNTFDSYNGGGFMATQTADTSFTPAAKNCEIQGLRSLTVKQISEASQPSNDKMNCMVDGNEVNVKLVGLLSQKAEMVSYISFLLDDGTGRINCIRWENDAVDSKEIKLLSDGMYVKVHGHLKKVFEENEGVVVYSVRRVTDYDEIAYHFKDCMFVHLYNSTTRIRMKDVPQVTSPMSNAAVRTPSKGYQPTSSDRSCKFVCLFVFF